MKVMVETSARHVHVTQETLEKLFGAGATLTKKKRALTAWTICKYGKNYYCWP